MSGGARWLGRRATIISSLAILGHVAPGQWFKIGKYSLHCVLSSCEFCSLRLVVASYTASIIISSAVIDQKVGGE